MTITQPTAGLIGMALVLTSIAMGSGDQVLSKRVVGNLVFWDQARGFEAIAANADLFSEVSPFWYHVAADGSVVPYTTAAGATYEDAAIIAFLRERNILVMPTVANIVNGVWNGPLVSKLIADATLSSRNINNLVQLAVTRQYDGIDLDYEDLAASDRAAFSAFVNRLAVALHAQGKLLSVNVYAKTSEPGGWDGPKAQDWAAIGLAADQVRIMSYEYHWSTSEAGPISPIDWVTDVMWFARATIPRDKIMQGVPLYGYDWVGRSGTAIVWQEAMALANQHGVAIKWDAPSASPWFEYVRQNVRHTVWFENSWSLDEKLQVALAVDVGGVTLWRLGGEDPDNWNALRARFGGEGPAPDVVPPTVAITSPANGAVLQRKQRIDVNATDNVRVARVEIYVNGSLLATDTSAPYTAYWNTRRAPSGANVIQAIAYDAALNSSTTQVTVNSSK